MRRRVVVTGMGAACSLGLEIPEIWDAVLNGRSGAAPIRQFDSRSFPVHIGSEVDAGAIPLKSTSSIDFLAAPPYLDSGLWTAPGMTPD